MIKVELDGRNLLTVKEREASSTTLEAAAALEGELKEAKAKAKAWKSTSKVDKAELKSAQKDIEHNMEALRAAHAIENGLEKEKFELMKRNDLLECGSTDHQVEMEKLKAELELERKNLATTCYWRKLSVSIQTSTISSRTSTTQASSS